MSWVKSTNNFTHTKECFLYHTDGTSIVHDLFRESHKRNQMHAIYSLKCLEVDFFMLCFYFKTKLNLITLFSGYTFYRQYVELPKIMYTSFILNKISGSTFTILVPRISYSMF